jgi:hypothetical protein
MTDKKGIEYPVLATNWTSALWTRRIFPNGTTNSAVDKNSGEEFLSSSWSGLQKYAKSPDWALESARLRTGDDITPYIEPDLQVQNTALNVNGNTVKYSYNLKDFKEGYAIPSNHTVHSSANCSLIEVSDGRYWRWANGNRTGPFTWGRKNNTDVGVVPEVLQLANDTMVTQSFPSFEVYWVSILDLLNERSVLPQIYILCSNIAWECWPTLTETIGDNESHQIPPHERLFHPANLYQLLAVRNGIYFDQTDENYISLGSFSSSSIGVETNSGAKELCGFGLFDSPNQTVFDGYTLWMAGLVARRLTAAIMYANTDLPQSARSQRPNQTSGTVYLHTTLEVHWLRVVLILVSITSGIALATLTVLYYCAGIYTRDDSYLVTAELLKTVINRFDGGKLMTGEELAASLDDVLKAPVSYGTRKGNDGCPSEVDLASGLGTNFSPFPQRSNPSGTAVKRPESCSD